MQVTQQQERAQALADAFDKLDKNKDGQLNVEELRDGLSQLLKAPITDRQAEELMKIFDEGGDGLLQLNEFQGIEKLKSRLEQFMRDEKMAAIKVEMTAREAKMASEASEKRVQELIELLNSKPPSFSDKLLSIIPYLVPLIDLLQYGRVLLSPFEDNFVIRAWIILYNLYTKIPFAGLVAFFAIQVLSNDMKLNRLVRYNLQQAVYIDIALFFPAIIVAFCDFLPTEIHDAVLPIASDITFFVFFSMCLYSIGSSLLGVIPDKIPVISDQVDARVPSAEMFDAEGNFLGKKKEYKDDKDSNSDELKD